MYASEILFDKSIFFYYNTLLLGEVDMQKTNTRKFILCRNNTRYFYVEETFNQFDPQYHVYYRNNNVTVLTKEIFDMTFGEDYRLDLIEFLFNMKYDLEINKELDNIGNIDLIFEDINALIKKINSNYYKNYNIIKNTLVYYMNFYNEDLARRPNTNEYEYDYEEDVIKLQALNELTRERKISGNR